MRAGAIAGSERPLAALRSGLGHRALPALLLVPATVLALPFLTAGLRLDDYVVLAILSGREPLHDVYPAPLDVFNFFGGTAERTRRMLDLGLLPWWTYPHGQIAFWRPLAALTHWIDAAAWPRWPVLMHAQSLVWFGALVVTVTITYRQLMGVSWVAGLAALLYVVDDVHALGVGLVAGRNALIGTTLGALALTAHDRWRRDGSRTGALLAPLCLALSLLAAEGSAAIGGYLAAHALYLDRGSGPRRLAGLVPAGLVLLVWKVAYAGFGYGVLDAAPGYISPTREPALFFRTLAGHAPVMLLAQWGGPIAETYASLSGGAALARWCGSMLTLGAIGLLFLPLLRRNAVARFWALGQVLALAPAGASLPNDRYLFFVGLGAMGLIAQFLGGWVDAEAWRPAPIWWRAPAAALAGLLAVIHGVVAPIALVRAPSAVVALGAVEERASDSMPADPSLRGQILVIPTVPNAGMVTYSFFFRTVKGQPIPAHTRLLAEGASVELYRPDARTLVVRRLGPAPRMFRTRENPIAPGTRVDLTGTQVEVTAVDAEGVPREAIFRFEADLDSARLRWLRWTWETARRARYLPFAPPAIGERMRIE